MGHTQEMTNFLEEYQGSLRALKYEAECLFKECGRISGAPNLTDHSVKISKKIDALKSLSRYKQKIDELRDARGSCRDKCESEIKDTEHSKKKYIEFEDKISEIILDVNSYAEKAHGYAIDAHNKIKECKFGVQEGKNKYAAVFHQYVLQFFDWIFINELERIDLKKIEDESQKRDGVYKVREEFDIKKRCGREFHEIYLECKNFCMPSYHSINQLFSYTFHCCGTGRKPLSILVSRENPTKDSGTARVRRAIFRRPIDGEERLILFLDDGDLEKMLFLDEKEEDRGRGDPAAILKDKIDDFIDEMQLDGGA